MSSVFGALIEPVELEPVDRLGPVHFIAIGGAGMSGIASLYADLGIPVSGSDQADSPQLEQLRACGATVFVGHAADQLGDAQTVVVSSAITADNPELVVARERGLRIWHRSAALAALMLGRPGIAVGGTHGKTTTSAMVAHLLTECGRAPGFVVGAALASGESSRLGAPDAPFVVEADESDGSFLQYLAEVAVITNIEADHLDNWGNADTYLAGFGDFARQATRVVGNLDDAQVAALLPDDGIGFGAAPGAALPVEQIRLTGFGSQALLAGVPLRLQVPGEHNVANAAAAVLAAHCVGVGIEEGCRVLASFRGTHRRFMAVGEAAGIRVFDDYAHHPTELRATLSAARSGLTDGPEQSRGRVIACFQPHLFSRTRDFLTEFGAALALADEVVLTEIYPARERAEDFLDVNSARLAEECSRAGGSVRLVGDRAEVATTVADLARSGDVVLTLGAGDITEIAPEVVAALEQRR